MPSPLDRIVAEATADPPELPRLTTAGVFLAYHQLGNQLGIAADLFKDLPADDQRNSTVRLQGIVKACEAAIVKAQRLLEANR